MNDDEKEVERLAALSAEKLYRWWREQTCLKGATFGSPADVLYQKALDLKFGKLEAK